LGRYRLVLVTNLREFSLVGPDTTGGEATLESLRLTDSEAAFTRRLARPRAFAREAGAGLGEYLTRGFSPGHLSHKLTPVVRTAARVAVW
jgi:hypothetical protein